MTCAILGAVAEACAQVGLPPEVATPMFGEGSSISTPLALLAVVFLVLANGFFVATEFALVSVRRTRVQQIAAEGDRRAKQVLTELSDLDTYIAATQLGITMASLGLGWIGEPAVAKLIEPLVGSLQFIPESSRETVTHTVSFAVGFSTITALHIVLGELAPKSIALQRAEQTALLAAAPVHYFYLAFRPVISGLNAIGNAVVRLIGIEPASGHQLVQSAEELRLAVDASRAAGLVGDSAHNLVDRALLFPDVEVRHAMVPRTEMEALSVDTTLDDVLMAATTSGYSRFPVYEGDVDHVIGLIDVRRLLPHIVTDRGRPRNDVMETFQLRDVMTPIIAIPETAPAAALLPELRAAEAPIAIAIDEYGGTAGLVTLVDLMESLVGEIADVAESMSPSNVVSDDGSYSLDGLTTLLEAREFHDLELDDDVDVETVGGYVFSQLGRPAIVGDEVTGPDGDILRVDELDGLRISRVRVFPSAQALGIIEMMSGPAA